MVAEVNVPNLKHVGGAINVSGNRNLSEKNFPSLEFVGGDMHLGMSGFELLPSKLTTVVGNIYLSSELPKTLVDDCLAKKAAGIVKGEIYMVGGKVTNSEDGKIVYEEMVNLTNSVVATVKGFLGKLFNG